jgi:hypothetical protein
MNGRQHGQTGWSRRQLADAISKGDRRRPAPGHTPGAVKRYHQGGGSPIKAPPSPCARVCGGMVTHAGYHLHKGMCTRRRATNPSLICTDWSGIERRALLPVRERLRHKPPRLISDHALVVLSLSRGWADDDDCPFIMTDIPLAQAESLPFVGQA